MRLTLGSRKEGLQNVRGSHGAVPERQVGIEDAADACRLQPAGSDDHLVSRSCAARSRSKWRKTLVNRADARLRASSSSAWRAGRTCACGSCTWRRTGLRAMPSSRAMRRRPNLAPSAAEPGEPVPARSSPPPSPEVPHVSDFSSLPVPFWPREGSVFTVVRGSLLVMISSVPRTQKTRPSAPRADPAGTSPPFPPNLRCRLPQSPTLSSWVTLLVWSATASRSVARFSALRCSRE